MGNNAFLKLMVIGLFFLMAGCVSLKVSPQQTTFTTHSPQMRQAALQAINNWTMSGAFSIVMSHQSPEIANFDWTQSKENYQLALNSSLNLYRIVIQKNGQIITLTKNGQFVAQANTPEELMQKVLGWSLPVADMQYWIKGIPVQTMPFVGKYDRYGHLVDLQQAGFDIRYLQYQTLPSGIDIPQLMSVQNEALFAKIVVKKGEMGVV